MVFRVLLITNHGSSASEKLTPDDQMFAGSITISGFTPNVKKHHVIENCQMSSSHQTPKVVPVSNNFEVLMFKRLPRLAAIT